MNEIRNVVGGYREYAPDPAASSWIEAFWVHVAPGPDEPRTQHRVVNDVAPSMVFESVRDEGGTPHAGRLLLLGPVWTPRIYQPEPGVRMEGVRIKPEWSRALIGADLGDHGDGIDDVTEIDRSLGGPLLDRLQRTRNTTEAWRALVQALTGKLPALPARDEQLAHAALESIREQPAPQPLEHLASELGITSRHLRRVITAMVGSSPRRFGRVERFLRVLADADGTTRPDWLGLAVQHGYADQAHLIREAKALSGLTPTALHAERQAEN